MVSTKLDVKMINLVIRGYLKGVFLLALISLFTVPKLTEYIITVFYSTVGVFNESLWDPNFILLVLFRLLFMVDSKTHMVYLDSGEIFYTFRLY